MRSYPSRAEVRETKLYAAAESGNLSLKNSLLYPAEIKRLEKEGFQVSDVKPSGIRKNLYSATIDWSRAYGNAIPHIVFSYINGIIETEPQNSISNFAQKLYVIAHRNNTKR